MSEELNDRATEDPEGSDDSTDSGEGEETETISEASLDDMAGDDTDDDVDPDALVDDNESDNDLADIRRRIEKLEEEKQLQSDLDYLDEGFDD